MPTIDLPWLRAFAQGEPAQIKDLEMLPSEFWEPAVKNLAVKRWNALLQYSITRSSFTAAICQFVPELVGSSALSVGASPLSPTQSFARSAGTDLARFSMEGFQSFVHKSIERFDSHLKRCSQTFESNPDDFLGSKIRRVLQIHDAVIGAQAATEKALSVQRILWSLLDRNEFLRAIVERDLGSDSGGNCLSNCATEFAEKWSGPREFALSFLSEKEVLSAWDGLSAAADCPLSLFWAAHKLPEHTSVSFHGEIDDLLDMLGGSPDVFKDIVKSKLFYLALHQIMLSPSRPADDFLSVALELGGALRLAQPVVEFLWGLCLLDGAFRCPKVDPATARRVVGLCVRSLVLEVHEEEMEEGEETLLSLLQSCFLNTLSVPVMWKLLLLGSAPYEMIVLVRRLLSLNLPAHPQLQFLHMLLVCESGRVLASPFAVFSPSTPVIFAHFCGWCEAQDKLPLLVEAAAADPSLAEIVRRFLQRQQEEEEEEDDRFSKALRILELQQRFPLPQPPYATGSGGAMDIED